MTPTIYRCVWSNQVKMITAMTSALFLLAFGFVFNELNSSGDSVIMVVLFTLFATVGVCVVYSPRRIVVTEDEVIIQSIGKNKQIKRSDIEYVGECSLKGSIRTFGSGGYFGYLWWFYNRSIGHFFAYAVHEKGLVLIETSGRKYVVSCESSLLLIAQLKGR